MAGEIKHDAIVRSADGGLYLVRYVHQARQEADLSPFDPALCSADLSAEQVSLPLAELRRVVDPRNRLPPIQGLPAERPRCQHCDRPLRPVVDRTHHPLVGGGSSFRVKTRTFRRWTSYRGLFCTLGCALNFAEAAHRAGYRIVRKG